MKQKIISSFYNIIQTTLTHGGYTIFVDGLSATISDPDNKDNVRGFSINLGWNKDNKFVMECSCYKHKSTFVYPSAGYYLDNLDEIYINIKKFSEKIIKEM